MILDPAQFGELRGEFGYLRSESSNLAIPTEQEFLFLTQLQTEKPKGFFGRRQLRLVLLRRPGRLRPSVLQLLYICILKPLERWTVALGGKATTATFFCR